MKPFNGRTGVSHLSTLGDILLVVIGSNLLVLLAIARPSAGVEVLVGTAAVTMLLTGGLRMGREIIWRS
jgi:hypothetical protein